MPKKLRQPRKPKLGSTDKVQAHLDSLAKKYGPETTLHSDMEEKYNRDPTAPKQTFWYVFGFTKTGKKVILGPKMTSQEADQLLATLDDGEIFELKTRDLSKATREIKAILLDRTKDPDYAIERVKHQPPERE